VVPQHLPTTRPISDGPAHSSRNLAHSDFPLLCNLFLKSFAPSFPGVHLLRHVLLPQIFQTSQAPPTAVAGSDEFLLSLLTRARGSPPLRVTGSIRIFVTQKHRAEIPVVIDLRPAKHPTLLPLLTFLFLNSARCPSLTVPAPGSAHRTQCSQQPYLNLTLPPPTMHIFALKPHKDSNFARSLPKSP
jgi:hypothetical protein